jgi:hypothetical protein
MVAALNPAIAGYHAWSLASVIWGTFENCLILQEADVRMLAHT